MSTVIDFHCHAGEGDRLTAPWNTAAPLDTYLRRARATGIQRTVVVPPFHSDYRRANAHLAGLVARYPDRLIGFAAVHPVRDSGRIPAMLSQAVREWGFRGVKVHGSDAFPTREVCEAVRALGLPLLVDVFGRAYVIEMLAREFPDVRFVVPHLGSFADDWRAQQQVVDQLARFPNLYADTSGVRRFDYLVRPWSEPARRSSSSARTDRGCTPASRSTRFGYWACRRPPRRRFWEGTPPACYAEGKRRIRMQDTTGITIKYMVEFRR